jgi:hypothetical protein
LQFADKIAGSTVAIIGSFDGVALIKTTNLCILLLVLISCATPYQEKGFRGGFSEIQTSKDTFEVSFEGNGYTSEDKTAKYLLLRCAELTISNGGMYFLVSGLSGIHHSPSTLFKRSPTYTATPTYGGKYQIQEASAGSSGTTLYKKLFKATIRIVPENTTEAYDAKLLIQQLRN